MASFAAAYVCGYALMSERWTLTSFWFPTTLWMLSILDHAKVGAMGGRESWLLLFALVVFFIGFLHAKATRRVALWTRHPPGRVAVPVEHAVLRTDPARGLAQAGWLGANGAVGALALLLDGMGGAEVVARRRAHRGVGVLPKGLSSPRRVLPRRGNRRRAPAHS